MRITRRLEFDAGHRIPSHDNRCRHLHGHRYAIEITLSGDVVTTAGTPQEGMVLDYSDIKLIAARAIVDPWDHAFLAYSEDHAVIEFLASLPDHKTVVLPFVPTAENLSLAAFRVLDKAFSDAYGDRLQLERVRLYETPNCWADALRAEVMLEGRNRHVERFDGGG